MRKTAAGRTTTVPAGLAYVASSLTASAGTVDDGDAPALRWWSSLAPDPVVTVTYAATVSTADPQVIINTAIIAVPGHEDISRSATVCANCWHVYLPLVFDRGTIPATGGTTPDHQR